MLSIFLTGIDVNETNSEGSNVLDLLIDLPSERSQEITALIYGKYFILF